MSKPVTKEFRDAVRRMRGADYVGWNLLMAAIEKKLIADSLNLVRTSPTLLLAARDQIRGVADLFEVLQTAHEEPTTPPPPQMGNF